MAIVGPFKAKMKSTFVNRSWNFTVKIFTCKYEQSEGFKCQRN